MAVGSVPVDEMLLPVKVPFKRAQEPVNDELTVPDGVKLPDAVIVAAGTLWLCVSAVPLKVIETFVPAKVGVGNVPVEVILFPVNVPFNRAQVPLNDDETEPDGVKLPEAVIVAAGTL